MSHLGHHLPGYVPIGSVMPYAGPLADADKNPAPLNLAQIRAELAHAGWLYCDGSSYACGDYWLLYGVIGNAFGGDGTHFNVPNLCGRFMRGVDNPQHPLDPSAAQRSASASGGNTGNQVGSVQADAYQAHEHNYKAPAAPLTVQPGEATVYGPALLTQATEGQEPGTPGGPAPRTDSETRPVNIYLNYIIRYR